MRQSDNANIINIYDLIGKGYERAWFTNCDARYRCFCGARNTKKSYDILGFEPIFKILSDDRRNVMICRKNDSDNRQSTYENILGRLIQLGLLGGKYFKATTSPLEITYLPTGQKIIFRGLNNPTSLNSITFAHGYLTDVYIEEAFELDSYLDFRKLDGSLRGKYPGITLQITMCFNAWDGESWLYHEFFKNRLEDDFDLLDNPKITYIDYYDEHFKGPYGKGLYLHKSTYKINEFRDVEIYDASALERKEKDIESYKVEFLGMFGVTAGKVYTNFSPELVVPIQKLISCDKYGQPVMWFDDFAIGIDTGLSDGEGKIKKVLKNESQDVKIKAATTMTLGAITSDFKRLITFDEYFHSNNPADNAWNTDNRNKFTEPEQVEACVKQIRTWILEYQSSPTILMKGEIKIYVDSADIGFRQALEIKLREYQIFNCRVMASMKKTIRTRTSYTNLLMAYGDFLICDKCKNFIRELKNARKGKGNIAREDTNDHVLTASEYNLQPFYDKLKRWKDFKEH